MKKYTETRIPFERIEEPEKTTCVGTGGKVRYRWTEDGEVELCESERVTVEEETRCYHCDCPIRANEAAVKLVTSDGSVYMLHSCCAERGAGKQQKREGRF